MDLDHERLPLHSDERVTLLELALAARRPTRVNGGDKQGYVLGGNSSVNLASHRHCAGVFIGI